MPLFRLHFVPEILITLRHNSVFCALFNQKINYFYYENQTTNILLDDI
jgi:hypothetical protein